MSWSTDDGRHEGWAACYFEDGNVSSGWQAGGPFGSACYPVLPWEDRGGDLFWAKSEALGAVAVCSCGWRGSRRTRKDPEVDLVREDCAREWSHHVSFWDNGDRSHRVRDVTRE